MGERILADLTITDDPTHDSAQHLLSFALQLRRFVLRHAGLDTYLQTLSPRGVSGRQLLADEIAALQRRGYAADAAMVLSSTVANVVIGATAAEQLHSEPLFDAVEACPTAWLRFWMPDPADPEVEHQRAHTIALAEPATGDFAVDVVLHEPAGPGSAWAQQAEPGDAVSLTSIGSSRFEVSAEPPAGYLVIGDGTGDRGARQDRLVRVGGSRVGGAAARACAAQKGVWLWQAVAVPAGLLGAWA